jgi:hypothetical protein
MRKFFMTAFVLAAAMIFATTGLALEKTAARFDDSRADFWSQDYSCSVHYYNYCTGWIWCWSGWSANEMIGTCFAGPCCGPDAVGSTLAVTWLYCCGGSPTGYGFTGSMQIWGADASCNPTGCLAAQPWLLSGGWNMALWGISVPSPFIAAYVYSPNQGDPSAPATDHPAAGPTGPQACGYCYPSPRTTFSFYYGTPTTLLVPGSPLNDGICDSELMFDAGFTCIVGVEESSWGTIKGLYR